MFTIRVNSIFQGIGKMKIKHILLIALLGLLAAEQYCSGEEKRDYVDTSTNKKNRLERMQELRDALDMKMSFYGKVIDQEGKPVTGAQVFIGIRRSMSESSPVIKTDNLGLFNIRNEKCHLINIRKIVKEGYEYKNANNPLTGVWADDIRTGKFNPDPTNPVTIKTRKKEPPVFVIPNEYRLLLNATVGEKEICLITGHRGKIGKLGTNSWAKDEHADVRLKAVATDKRNHVITFTTSDKDAGLTMSDSLLYIVPADGYQPSLSLTTPSPGKTQIHLYVKGRQGTMFSRLDVEINATDESTVVHIQAWTNPGSSRNVDYDGKIYVQEIERRNEERKQRHREKIKNPDPLQCCIYSWAREKYGPLNCFLPTDNRCPSGTTGHPWACEKLDWCK
jgi:hypothetical protein